MATQRFLNGGYTGKLGQTVGQRWHDRLIIREYVVPRNPRTPKQIAWRNLFKKAISLSQQAINLNGGAEYWKKIGKNEFSSRTSTALKRLRDGMSEADALPLYPDGYVSDTFIGGFAATFNMTNRSLKFTSTSPVLTEARRFYVTLNYFSGPQNKWQLLTMPVDIGVGKTWEFAMTWVGNFSFPDGSWVESATGDDNSHDGNGIALLRQPVSQPEGN